MRRITIVRTKNNAIYEIFLQVSIVRKKSLLAKQIFAGNEDKFSDFDNKREFIPINKIIIEKFKNNIEEVEAKEENIALGNELFFDLGFCSTPIVEVYRD